ncbi:MAG: hypothetical protein JSS44_08950 [Proteobacteria bacterium]|nr:hypothetical protein [Pseudomonadota bacterium]MBS0501729.1 hypothetical protein [Pseudomonadota bacterium]
MSVKPARAETRGRKPMKTQPLQTVEVNESAVEELRANTALMEATTASYSAERDLVNQLLGQAQMADALSQFSRTVRLSKLAYVKENKLYKAIAGKKMPNGSACEGTWEEFCNLLGHSKDKVDLDLQNLRTFGAEALEAMSRMGIGYRDLRQFRQLSADDHSALAEAARTGDKEAVLDLAEDLIARQAKEKEKLADKLEKKTHEYESLAERQEDLSQKLDEAKARAALLPRLKPDAKAADMLVELQADMVEARAKLRQAMRSVEVFHQHLREYDIDAHDSELAALMVELLQLVVAPVPELAIGGIPQPLDFIKTIV